MASSRKIVHFGSMMRGCRAALGIPQKAVAIELGLSEGNLSTKLSDPEVDPDFLQDYYLALGGLRERHSKSHRISCNT